MDSQRPTFSYSRANRSRKCLIFVNRCETQDGFRSSSVPRRKKVAFTGILIFIVSGLSVSTPSICATTRGPSTNSTAPEQYGLFRSYPSSIIAGGPIEIQVKATSRPSPFVSTHSISEPWHLVHRARGGTKRAPHPTHRAPISFSSSRNCSNW